MDATEKSVASLERHIISFFLFAARGNCSARTKGCASDSNKNEGEQLNGTCRREREREKGEGLSMCKKVCSYPCHMRGHKVKAHGGITNVFIL